MALHKSITEAIIGKKDLSKPGRENWIADESVTECSCGTKFSLLTRKHHCRACGHVFCAACTKHEVLFTHDSRKDEEGYVEKEKRVCAPCCDNIVRTRHAEEALKAQAIESADMVLAIRVKLAGDNLLPEEAEQLRAKLEELEEAALRFDAQHTQAEMSVREAEGATDAAPAEPEPEDDSGAYLVFSPSMQGVMYMVWSKTKIQDALAFGKPRVKVPEFKFARDGRWELYRNINGNKSSYYLAWAMFVKGCAKFECSIVDLGEGELPPPMPVSLMLHCPEGNKIRRVPVGEPFTLQGVDGLAAVHTDFQKLDVDNIVLARFLELGKESGASVTIG